MLTVVVLWAANNVITKSALDRGLEPLIYVSLRLGLVALLLFPYLRLRGVSLRVRHQDIPRFVVSGLCGFAFYNMLYIVGLAHTSAFSAAIIIALALGQLAIGVVQGQSTVVKIDGSSTVYPITEAVAEEVAQWQSRPLEAFYPVIFLDALIVKIRDGNKVSNRAAHIAVGIDMDGVKHVLGIWIQANEGAKFWAGVCADLANRGVKDVLIVCTDGLSGWICHPKYGAPL